MSERELPEAMPDDAQDKFMRFLLQADLANVARLHAAGMKAGYTVNGRTEIHPIGFPLSVLGEFPATPSNAFQDIKRSRA